MSGDPMQRFLDLVLANPTNRQILDRIPALGVADAWLVAGCLFGPVWNALSGQPANANINDYDIFYWDPDTTWEAENEVIQRADELFADIGVEHQVRNQARVPCWFEKRFSAPYPATRCTADNIGRFIVACTCVGVRARGSGDHEICAPKGFDDLFGGRLRCNPDNPTPDRFRSKCASFMERWPWLMIDDAHPEG